MSKLEIRKIQNDSKDQSECITLYASEDVQLGHYAVLDRTFSKDNKLSNKFRHFHQLPNKAVRAGEFVRLFTGTGTDKTWTWTNKDKISCQVHDIYWGSGENILNNNSKDQVTLISFQYVDGMKVPA